MRNFSPLLKKFILGTINLTIECEEDYTGFTVMSNHIPVFRSTSLSNCWHYIAMTVSCSETDYSVEGETATEWLHQMTSKGLINSRLFKEV